MHSLDCLLIHLFSFSSFSSSPFSSSLPFLHRHSKIRGDGNRIVKIRPRRISSTEIKNEAATATTSMTTSTATTTTGAYFSSSSTFATESSSATITQIKREPESSSPPKTSFFDGERKEQTRIDGKKEQQSRIDGEQKEPTRINEGEAQLNGENKVLAKRKPKSLEEIAVVKPRRKKRRSSSIADGPKLQRRSLLQQLQQQPPHEQQQQQPSVDATSSTSTRVEQEMSTISLKDLGTDLEALEAFRRRRCHAKAVDEEEVEEDDDEEEEEERWKDSTVRDGEDSNDVAQVCT